MTDEERRASPELLSGHSDAASQEAREANMQSGIEARRHGMRSGRPPTQASRVRGSQRNGPQ